jgi:predicted transcriptional regulator
LYEKELLSREKVSHAHVYRPRVSRQEFQRGLPDHLVTEVLRGEASAMLSTFVDLTERARASRATRSRRPWPW